MEHKKVEPFGRIVKTKQKRRYACQKCCSYLTGERCHAIRIIFKVRTCDTLAFEKIETGYYKQKRF